MKSNDINALVAANMAEQYGLTFMERGFYEILRSFKCNKKHTATPGIGTIAKAMGCCRNTAKKYIKKLVEKGLIWITERPVTLEDGRKWNDTHLYTFVAEKYGEARVQNEKKVEEQTETGYQKVKSSFQLAKKKLSKTHPIVLVEKAVNIALGNVRKGITRYIKLPLKYLQSIIQNLLEEDKQAKAQLEYANSVPSTTDKEQSEKPKKVASYSPVRKTKFHNFEQRSSNYTNDDLERMIRVKNGQV